MEVKAISFAGKTPKVTQTQKAYNKAMEEIFGQSDKDYFSITKQVKTSEYINPKDFIQKARKFFVNVFEV